MPKVSVLIPAYNAMNYLPETVDSVLAQTFTDFEIIIVNDGSKDDIEAWHSSLTDPRIKLFSQSNQGKSVAVNKGISLSQGKYIAFLDAYDLWEVSKLEKQVCCLDSHPEVGLVYTWTAYIDETGKPTGRVLAPNSEGSVWKSLIVQNFLACGSNPMVRRFCFDVVGVFSPELPPAEDWDMWLRIASHYRFAVLKQPLVCYRKHAANISSKLHLMQKSSTLALERALQSAPLQYSDVYDRAYRSLYLYFGWLAIQKYDYRQALIFWHNSQKAVPYSISYESLRLRIAIFVIRWFGSHNYCRLLKVRHRFHLSVLTTFI